MNAHWQTNLGGAVSVTGTTLIGVGVLAQLTQVAPENALLTTSQLTLMWYVALFGFVLSAVGKGMTALFAADAKTVNSVADAVDRINQQGPSAFAPPATEKQEAGSVSTLQGVLPGAAKPGPTEGGTPNVKPNTP